VPGLLTLTATAWIGQILKNNDDNKRGANMASITSVSASCCRDDDGVKRHNQSIRQHTHSPLAR
jgi:hypothetical protein